ncbi:MAG: hypothetical protein M0P01_03145 [Treponema sp.]|nr:hypothetical protein [Treponema sp.]
MLFVSGTVLTIFCVLAAAFAGTGGFISYRYLLAAGQKQQAELVFYCILVAIIFLVVLYIIILVRAGKRTGEFRHLIDIAREGGKVDDDRFMKFGTLGQGIKILFRETEDISSKRAQRIRYLNNAITALMSVSDEPVLLLDAGGAVIQASPAYFEKYAEPGHSSEVYGADIDKVHPEIDFLTQSQKMIKNHSAVNVAADKFSAQLLPVFTTNQTPDGYLVVFGRNSLFTIAANKVAEKSAEHASVKDVLQPAAGKDGTNAGSHKIAALFRALFKSDNT